MIDDVRDLSRAEKEKAIARKDISGYIGKCFVTAIVAVFAMTLFALYMIGNFMDAFTAKNALATTAIFIASGVLTVFLMAGIYRFTHQKGTSVRDFHLTIILVVVTFMASIATATKFNLYAMPIALATLVLIELIDRRSATLSTAVVAIMIAVAFMRDGVPYDYTTVIASVVCNSLCAIIVNFYEKKHI